MTVKMMHSFLRRIETLRDLLTPLSKHPTSRVPHSVLWASFGIKHPMPSHRRSAPNANDIVVHTAHTLHQGKRGEQIAKGTEEGENKIRSDVKEQNKRQVCFIEWNTCENRTPMTHVPSLSFSLHTQSSTQ